MGDLPLDKLIPLLLISGIIFTVLGWWLRSRFGNVSQLKSEAGQAREQVHRLEQDLAKAKQETKVSQAATAKLEASQIDPDELDDLRKQLEAARTDANSLRNQAQKARQSLDAANARAKDAVKGPQERVFALENELSKMREEVARLKSSAAPETQQDEQLVADLDKAKRSLATATTAFGKAQRENEALQEELDRLKGKAVSQPKVRTRITGAAAPNPAAAREIVETLKSRRRQAGGSVPPEPKAAPEESVVPEEPVVPEPAPEPVKPTLEPQPVESVESAEVEEAPAKEAAPEPEEKAATPKSEESGEPAELLPGMESAGGKLITASEVLGRTVMPEDLKVVEGIGPKIEALLTGAGIADWKALADAAPEAVKEILSSGGEMFAIHDPSTWPKQAGLLAEGKWQELKELQDELQRGREASEASATESDAPEADASQAEEKPA